MTHPIIACASDISTATKSAAGVDPMFMSAADKQEALLALTEARSQLDALLMRVLASSDDVGEVHGLRDAAAWLAVESRTTRRDAARELRLARQLEAHPAVAASLQAGALRAEQARAIVDALDALPATVSCAIRAEARSTLLDLAGRHDAKELKQIGKRILDIVAPQVGESEEARKLAQEEARAAATVSFTIADDGEGRCHGKFTLPSHIGKILKRHLQALANPARHDDADLKDDRGEWKPLSQRMGEAFVEYVERYPTEASPLTAGVNPTIVITMTLDQLLGDNAPALLDDGTRMTAGQARRLACEAGIIPVVLGSKSQPLDLGRTQRLYSKPQRIALGLRDGGCTARGCDTSASGCHAHHDRPWSRGGRTDLADGRLLCPRHHRLAHDSRYDMQVHSDSTVSFSRRT